VKPSRIVLGHFHTAGSLVVSDPCYVTKHTEWSPDESGDVFQAKRVADAKVFEANNEGGEELEVEPGLWVVFADSNERESYQDLHNLVALKVGALLDGYLTGGKLHWEHEFDVGVDAGMFGFYDIETAPKSWDYMALIESDDHVYEYGPIIHGLNDGEYPVHVLRDDFGAIVGVKLVSWSSRTHEARHPLLRPVVPVREVREDPAVPARQAPQQRAR
jgi:hypothetical protein